MLRFPTKLTIAALCSAVIPVPLHAQCCGGGGTGSSGFTSSPHGSLARIFGGSDYRPRIRLHNSSSDGVDVVSHGRAVIVADGETRILTTGGVNAALAETPLLPGESYQNSVTNVNNSMGGEVTEELEDEVCPKPYVFTGSDGSGWEEAPEETETPVPEYGMTNTGPKQMVPAPEKGWNAAQDSGGNASASVDQQDFGHGGGTLDPGSLSLNTGLMSVNKTWPGVVAAVSMGPSANGSRGRIGFIVPDRGGNSAFDFKDADDYATRGADAGDYQYSTVGTPGTSNYRRRWLVSGQGWISLEQTVALNQALPAVTFKFYAAATTFSTTSPYDPNGGATPFRTMKLEKITAGNPNGTLYQEGCKVTTSWPGSGRGDEVKTMWWNVSGSTLEAYTSWSTGRTVVTSSTILAYSASPKPLRTLDTTITETFEDASNNSKTITHRTRESIRVLDDGDEQVESRKAFLRNDLNGPYLETLYYYWDGLSTDDDNYRRERMHVNPDGSWAVQYRNGDVHYALRGWKDTAAPASTAVDTGAEVMALVDDANYAGTVTTYNSTTGRMSSEITYADGNIVAKIEDTTASNVHRRTIKRYADATNYFTTVTLNVADSGGDILPERRHLPEHVYELKQGTTDHTTNSNVIRHTVYYYQTAILATPTPGYTIDGTYTKASPLRVVNRILDVKHLPTLMERTVTDVITGNVIASEEYMVAGLDGGLPDPAETDLLKQRRWTYDSRGRRETEYVGDTVVQSWSYPGDLEVRHRGSDGVIERTVFAPTGHIVYTMKEGVAANEFSTSITADNVAAQPYIWNHYEYTALASNNTQNGLYEVKVTEVAREGDWPTAPIVMSGMTPWSRETRAYIDGTGRTVWTKDVLDTQRLITHPNNGSPSPVVTTSINGTTVSATASYLDGQLKSVTGNGVVAEYYDYDTGAYTTDTIRSLVASPASGDGKETTRIDGLGRTVNVNLPVYDGVSIPQTLAYFDAPVTYDVEGRTITRKSPGAGGAYFDVSSHTDTTVNSTSTVTTTSARGADDDIDNAATDSNFRQTVVSYVASGNTWYRLTEVKVPNIVLETGTVNISWDGSTYVLAASTRELLGPFPVTTGTTWVLTGNRKTISGGKETLTNQYVNYTLRQTLTQVYVDGILQQSVTGYNGLPVLYETPQFLRTRAWSPLADVTVEPSLTTNRWVSRNIDVPTGLAASVTMPGSSDVRESYTYYSGGLTGALALRSGLVMTVTRPVTGGSGATEGVTRYEYNDRGELIRQWGGGDYPVEYVYDSFGRMTDLKTWRSGTWTGTSWPTVGSPDTTGWTYPAWFNQPNAKTYMAAASGEGVHRRKVRYLYAADGSLAYREWQRTPNGNETSDDLGEGVATVYTYDAFGRLIDVDYPDASTMATATADVEYVYNAAGRVYSRTDGTGITYHHWTAWGGLINEWHQTSIAGTGNQEGRIVRTFDSLNRLDKLDAQWGTDTGYVAPQVDYGFDSNGNLSTVTAAGRTITTAYASGTLQWGTRTGATGGTTLLSGTRTVDTQGRTSYAGYTAGGTVMQSFTYSYDRDKVTKMVREQGNANDEMAWLYGYDAKGQVTNADKRFSTSGSATGNFLAGHQTGYTYDEAGNRLTKIEGGSDTGTEGTGTRTTTYSTTNTLNQYTAITHPSNSGATQDFEVTGRRGSGSNTVTVNGSSTGVGFQANTSTGLHYNKVLSHTSTSGQGSYEAVTVAEAGTTIDSGNYYLPPPSETLSYDADGNLRQDGRFDYLWDAENRLTELTTRHTTINSTYPALKISFGYDGLSRRVWKKVEKKTSGGGSWTFEKLETYLYDGWNLLMRVDHTSGGALSDRQSFVWGPDMASHPGGHGSWQAAGGIGGLLLVLDKAAAASGDKGKNYFPMCDRMGNITGYIHADGTSTVTAKARTSNVATITTSSPHGLVAGQTVTVALSPADAGFDGTWIITAVTSTTFNYACTGSNVASTSTGGIARPATPIAASYDFDAFGREMKSLGFASEFLPFRFSSKFTDTEHGLIYYGYRYYDSVSGRWINRDPIEEDGGMMLYVFSLNNGISIYDILGLAKPGKGKANTFLSIKDKVKAILADPDCQKCEKLNPNLTKILADLLADELVKLWAVTYDEAADKANDQRVGGHWCWDWAKAFMNMANQVAKMSGGTGFCPPKYRQFYENKGGGEFNVHWAVELCFGKCDLKKCCISIDDGFFEGDMVHDSATWPKDLGAWKENPVPLLDAKTGDPAVNKGREIPIKVPTIK